MKTQKIMPKAIAVAAATLIAAGTAQAGLTLHQDKNLRVNANGRIQLDALLNSDLPANRRDDTNVRRARLGLSFKYLEDWRAQATVDFPDDVRIRDLRVEYRGLPVWLSAGRMQEPFGLGEQTSSLDTVLMERPQPTSIGPDYGLGFAANARGDLWLLEAGIFRTIDSEQLDGDRPENAITARGVFTPLRNRSTVLHFGGSVSQRERDVTRPGAGFVRFNAIAESDMTPGSRASTGVIANAEQYSMVGLETALRRGPLLLSGEWVRATVDVPGDPSYGGFYVEGAYTLTGERRDYRGRAGVFDGISPKRPLGRGGYGAVEVAARFSSTDLQDETLGGDTGTVLGAGVNWYPRDDLKVSLGGQRVERERIRRGMARPDVEDTVVQMRLQANF